MIAQYTAASIVSENKCLCHPACVDSIPTSAGQEDHVSMGMTSARKAAKIRENVEKVLAIELLCAVQGMDFRDCPGSPAVEALRKKVRHHVPPMEGDRIVSSDIDALLSLVTDRILLQTVEDETGNLE